MREREEEREQDGAYLPLISSSIPLREETLDAPLPLFAGGNFPLKEAEQIWFIAAKYHIVS